jgi:hypothetical protein
LSQSASVQSVVLEAFEERSDASEAQNCKDGANSYNTAIESRREFTDLA